MDKQLERYKQVDQLLDEVMRLPPGHPDRLRYLTLAGQRYEERPPASHRRSAPQAHPHPRLPVRK